MHPKKIRRLHLENWYPELSRSSRNGGIELKSLKLLKRLEQASWNSLEKLRLELISTTNSKFQKHTEQTWEWKDKSSEHRAGA